METWTDEDGQVWISCDALATGDYHPGADYGEANIRYLEDGEDAFVSHGAHGHKQLWLPDTPENRELVEYLEHDYPLLSDQTHAEVISDWEEEAWGSWIRHDLLNSLGRNSYLKDWAGEIPEQELRRMYWDVMSETNAQVVAEGSGVAIHDFDVVCHNFRIVVVARFWGDAVPQGWSLPQDETDARVLSDYLRDQGRELEADVLLELEDLL